MLLTRWAALLILAIPGLMRAAEPSLSDLIDRIEQTSRLQAPLAHIDTLISTAELLPVDKAYGRRRRELLDSAISLLGSVQDVESRYFYLNGAAQLLVIQDREEAEEICKRIPVRQSSRWRTDYRGRCWQRLVQADGNDPETLLRGLRTGAFQMPGALDLIAADPLHGGEILQAMMTAFPGRHAGPEDAALLDKASRLVAPFNLALAQEAARRLRDVPRPSPAAVEEDAESFTGDQRAEEAFRLADDLSLPPGVRSNRMARVLPLTYRMDNLARRLQLQGYLAAWFTAEGSTGLAAESSEALHQTLNTMCKDVDCLESVDAFVEFLAKQGIDPENLRVRHPSLLARLLLYELGVQLKR
jgi:hypothetical protein